RVSATCRSTDRVSRGEGANQGLSLAAQVRTFLRRYKLAREPALVPSLFDLPLFGVVREVEPAKVLPEVGLPRPSKCKIWKAERSISREQGLLVEEWDLLLVQEVGNDHLRL